MRTRKKCKRARWQVHFWKGICTLILLSISISTISAQTYCPANATPWQNWIKNVQLNTLEVSSGKCDGECGYTDFTSESTDLEQGNSYNITLSAGLSWNNPNANLWWEVWIDFNKDGVFSSSENVVSINGDSDEQSASINVPSSAPVGATRMRVALRKAEAPGACDEYGPGQLEQRSGEVEDFTVNIVDGGGGGGNCTWTDENVSFGLIASQIQYDPNNASATQTFRRDQASPYTYGEMIGVNQRSRAMNEVYSPNGGTQDDNFITETSSYVRAFHHQEKDYPQNKTPANSDPTVLYDPNNSAMTLLYSDWKQKWAAQGKEIDIIVSLTNAVSVDNASFGFPNKWWTAEQWGVTSTDIFENAKTYGFAFAETSCPNPQGECIVDMLEVGNEAWGYQDPETFKQVYRGMVAGVKEYFTNSGLSDDIETWPMGVMPGAFQAFRDEGIINGEVSLVYDHLGKRLPCDADEYMLGVNIHPYGFVNDVPNWKNEILYGLDREPENELSLFQFIKNGVYWRNVNLPAKEAGNPNKYKAKMYASEFGYTSQNEFSDCINDILPGVGDLTQGIYNLRAILMMSRLGYYRTTIYDSWDHYDCGYYGYGLYSEVLGPNGEHTGKPNAPKPHYYVIKNLKDELGNSRYLRAIHDGDNVNGTNLYAYVMGDAGGNPTHLVVWNGVQMDYAVGTQAVNNQRAAATSNGGANNVSINLSALGTVIVNTNQAKFLHDEPSQANYPTNSISFSNNSITMNVGPIPVMIPLNGPTNPCPSCNDGVQNCNETDIDCGGSCAPCPQGDLVLDINTVPGVLSAGGNFDLILTLTNNTNQTLNNISIDGSLLNFKNSSNYTTNNYAFDFQFPNAQPSGDGNFNTWSGEWSDFSVAPGGTATMTLELYVRNGMCSPSIPVSASGTTSGGPVSSNKNINCGGMVDPCQNGVQDLNEEGVDCGGPCPNACQDLCQDGILNQGETQIDCGGPCPPCPSTGMNLSILATPNNVGPAQEFTVLLTLTNNTNQVASNIIVDCVGLEHSNASTATPKFYISTEADPQPGNYNSWFAKWQEFSLAPGATATLTIGLSTRWSECSNGIQLGVAATSSAGDAAANTTVNCDVSNLMIGIDSNEASEIKTSEAFSILQLFPIPATDELSLVLRSKEEKEVVAQIANIHGELLLEKSINLREGMNNASFDIKHLPGGMYFLSLVGNKGKMKTMKFTKVKR